MPTCATPSLSPIPVTRGVSVTTHSLGMAAGRGADSQERTGSPAGRVVAVKDGPPAGGLVRERLTAPADARVVLVVAPAGHGKTTLLAQLAARATGPVVWYRVDGDDRSTTALLARLGPALLAAAGAAGDDDPAPAETETVLARLRDGLAGPVARPVLLVVDDVHLVSGSPGGSALSRLVLDAPESLRVVLAGRDAPLELADGGAADGVRHVGAEDLRFRAWEVERLFREVYRRPLPPEDAAALTARIEGWAAGLTMFDLLTRTRSAAERHAAVAELGRGSRLVRAYLVREVLADLPEDLRTFLRATSALGVLTGALCDALLGRTGSQGVLEELEQRQLFTTGDGRGGRFRYHQVLQDHLELELTEQLGADGARGVYRRAGDLLLEHGEVQAAFRAFARGQEWGRVEKLLADYGADIADRPDAVLAEPLPAGLRERDPWLVIAAARVLAARGSFEPAMAAYARAGALTEDSDVRDLCRQERQQLAVWLAGARPATTRPPGLLRAATQHGPARFAAAAADGPPDPGELLAVGAAALLAGDPAHAAVLFEQAAAGAGGDDTATAALAAAGGGFARMLDGEAARFPADEPVGPARDPGDLHGVLPTALVRLVVGAGASVHGDAATLGVLMDEADADGDSWGGALLRLLAGLAGLAGLARPGGPWGDAAGERDGTADAVVAAAEEAFAELEAPVLVHWARCVRLLPVAGPAVLADLGREGRALGAPGVVGVVRALAARRRVPAQGVPGPQPAPSPRPAVRVRLLGGFDVAVDGRTVDLGTVRPRVRAVVQLLALRAGTFVHRDVLAATLWPDSDLETGRRGVQVAVSTLRGLLQPGYRRQSTLLPRRGDAYALALPDAGASDVMAFDRELTRARHARARGDDQGAVAAWREAVALYRGDLLPEQGEAEWVVAERDRLRLAAADALESLGRALVAGTSGDGWGEGVETLRRALELDPFRDGAWRAMAEAYEAAGDLSAAAQVRRRHRRVLAELGVEDDGP